MRRPRPCANAWLPSLRAAFSWLSLSLLGALVSAGCVSPAPAVPLPERFLVLDTEDHEGFKALTPDEARVWVRVFEESGGDVAFWSEAVRLNFVDGRGYVLLEERELTLQTGTSAVELLFETRVTGRPTKYAITLFVRPAPALANGEVEVVVVEYGAPKDKFDTYLEEVRAAVAKL